MKFRISQIAACVAVGLLAGSFLSEPVQAQTYNVLHTFTCDPDGKWPSSGLLRTASGDLYTTTFVGGAHGAGAVFKLSENGDETVLYSFTGGADGGNPQVNGSLIQDKLGNLYGVTNGGGASACGVIFKLSPDGTETVLHTLSCLDGANPLGGLTRKAEGNFYGTAYFSDNGAGVVFRLTPGGIYKVLYEFTGGADGGGPYGDLLLDHAGNLYGSATFGGAFGQGAIFRVTPAGKETVLYSFTGGADGGVPVGLSLDDSGTFYGMTQVGGDYGAGVAFRLSPQGMYTVLHSFGGTDDGILPTASPIQDSAGNLYGTTLGGGTYGAGNVFELSPTGAETVLYNFTGGADGAYPFGGNLVLDASGTLYGTAFSGGSFGCGVVFSLTTCSDEQFGDSCGHDRQGGAVSVQSPSPINRSSMAGVVEPRFRGQGIFVRLPGDRHFPVYRPLAPGTRPSD
jgi:uncharacterized repeat protein (TIGR03803 family)